ncbi:hypothetical protein JJL45_11495 [Tamlana sp. s12]|uniref:DUF6090 family protein n=1 Tax=Tamlana sp. s12 TaxID=1630406 RepID=UPI000837ACA0|nr:DUF6090 family protein [Tamlana sp. s12]QQY84049.1 hypothetical protein JJL45_11495 [Tamlana sp. s12]
MIKFFRKIRQKMLTENKFAKYLTYAIGEIVLVVIGILIALWINNWNENRKLDEIRQSYYSKLMEDLEADKTYAKNQILKMESSISNFENYALIYKKPNLNLTEAFEAMKKNDWQVIILEFKSSTIKSLLNVGGLNLIDQTLRNNLESYNSSKNLTLNNFDRLGNSARNILENVTMQGGIAELMIRLENQQELKKTLEMENKIPDIFIKTEAYFAFKIGGYKGTIERLNNLIIDAEYNIELIKKRLNK